MYGKKCAKNTWRISLLPLSMTLLTRYVTDSISYQTICYLEPLQQDWLRRTGRSFGRWSVGLLGGLIFGLGGGLGGGLGVGLPTAPLVFEQKGAREMGSLKKLAPHALPL